MQIKKFNDISCGTTFYANSISGEFVKFNTDWALNISPNTRFFLRFEPEELITAIVEFKGSCTGENIPG